VPAHRVRLVQGVPVGLVVRVRLVPEAQVARALVARVRLVPVALRVVRQVSLAQVAGRVAAAAVVSVAVPPVHSVVAAARATRLESQSARNAKNMSRDRRQASVVQ
jgi:hypothetical protein